MGIADVRVDGQWIRTIAAVSNITDSTIYRTDGWSGDYQASCTWLAPQMFAASWLHGSALYEVIEGGKRTWLGLLNEPTPNDDGTWTLSAQGIGAQAADFRALAPNGGDLHNDDPTTIADTALDYAETWGCLIDRAGVSIGSTAVADPDNGDAWSLARVLDLTAKKAGARWWVDSDANLSLVTDPTTPTRMVTPGTAYLGTADDEYVSHMLGRFVYSLDATTGQPNAWRFVIASDQEMADRHGMRMVEVDLRPLGLLTTAEAQANIDGRFAVTGARMGWTNGLDLTELNSYRMGAGAVSPMGIKAGEMLRIPGQIDNRSTARTQVTIDIILGEVTRVHSEQRVHVTPVGFAPRDFAGALAAAVAPTAAADSVEDPWGRGQLVR